MLSIQRGTDPRADAAPRRRPSASFLLSVGVNALVIGAFFRALTEGYNWDRMLGRHSAPVTAERIGYLQLPRTNAPPAPGRSGGDGRPVSKTRSPALVAPHAMPSVLPPITRGPARDATGGSGPVVGTGGAREGIVPTYRDPALWTRPGTLVTTAPKTAKQRIDSVIADRFGGVRDSMLAVQAAQAGQRKPGDWTFKGPGGTWGMDDHSIHLGKISVPNAVLALLSSKFQQNLRGNPIAAVEANRMADVRRDLLDHAQMSMNEDDFRAAVKAIRERNDRARNERLAARKRAAELAGTGDEPASAPSAPSGATPSAGNSSGTGTPATGTAVPTGGAP